MGVGTLLYNHRQAGSLASCSAYGSWHAIKVTKGNKADMRGYEEKKATKYAPTKMLEGGSSKQSVFNLSFHRLKDIWVSNAGRGKINHSFIHPFTQQTFIECLLCAGHDARKWKHGQGSGIGMPGAGGRQTEAVAGFGKRPDYQLAWEWG